MPNSNCYYHVDKNAINTCSACLNQICDLCKTIDGFSIICITCLKKKKSTRKIKLIVSIITCMALTISIGLFIKVHEKPFAYGRFAFEINDLSDYLKKEPCDRSKIISFLETLDQAGDYRRVINETKTFNSKCGEYPRTYWVSFDAYKKLSLFDSAVLDASKIIENDQYDHDYRWWRGEAYQEWGKLDSAIKDYRQAISFMPALNDIPFRLADLLEKTGKPCEAIYPIEQYVYFHPESRRHIEVTKRLGGIYQDKCGEYLGSGKAEFKSIQNLNVVPIQVKINGMECGVFIFDTGANYVTINESMAKKLGIDYKGYELIYVQTAGGIKLAKVISIDKIQAKGLLAKNVEVAIMSDDDLGGNVQGLLGMSFLSRFNFELNNSTGILKISGK